MVRRLVLFDGHIIHYICPVPPGLVLIFSLSADVSLSGNAVTFIPMSFLQTEFDCNSAFCDCARHSAVPRLLQWDKVRGDVNPLRHDKKGTAFFIVTNSVITKTNGMDL